MSRRVMIGLWVLSAVAFLATEASAGCATIGGKRVCASWITGGSEIGLVTAEGYGENDGACPTVIEAQGQSVEFDGGDGGGGVIEIALVPLTADTLNLRLVGTVPTVPGTCGLGFTDNQFCDIKGVVFCGTAGSDPKHGADHPGKHLGHLDQGRAATTDGPLLVSSPNGFAQTDGSGRQFAGFRFQLSTNEQLELCPDGDFRTFVAEEGFFEACVNGTDCVTEFCTVNVNGIAPEEPRVYSCRPV